MDLPLFIKALSDAEKKELKYLLEQELGDEPLEKPSNRMTGKQWAKRHPTMSARVRNTFDRYPNIYMDELYEMSDREIIFRDFGRVSIGELRRFMDADKENLEAMGIKTDK